MLFITDMCRHTAYGSLSDIPGDLDILVAGSSCVDFSNLNSKKKTVDDGGESGDTFMGIMNYAKKHRPRIILLENVIGSSSTWPALSKKVSEMGYANAYVKLDSKDYYLPQTRQRGYMAAVLKDSGQRNNPQHIANNWAEKMALFKRQASSPLEDFLLDDDDDRVIFGRAELERGLKERIKEVEWIRYQARHRDYRSDLELGQRRPVTLWQEGGSSQGPAYYWRKWFIRQPSRVHDTIDASFLRGIKRGYDQNFKS